MKIKSEWELINKINKTISSCGIKTPRDLDIGIGDDCAVFILDENKYGLITTDISIENVHFKKEYSTPQNIGYKAMIGNLSDITAMGGTPKYAFISIGIPDTIDEKYILSIYKGMLSASKRSQVFIAGGDTSKSKELIINIALYGEVAKDRIVRRHGALVGHKIYVTGTLGDSIAGLEILESNNKKIKKFPSLIKKHLKPDCRYTIIDELIQEYSPSSMIDISDGLLSDLRHICEKSRMGFILDLKKIPVSAELKKYSLLKNRDAVKYALESGEEFELLFTSSKPHNATVNNIQSIKITQIGEIIRKGYFLEAKEKKSKIKISGYDHFKTL